MAKNGLERSFMLTFKDCIALMFVILAGIDLHALVHETMDFIFSKLKKD